jgi:aminoglycoside phosphotransferase (APT) family kinase protein
MNLVPSDLPGDVRKKESPDLGVLNKYLQHALPSIGLVKEIKQFPGGYSNLTFCLITDLNEYILRRPPIGANIKSAHDMGREFNVLSKIKPHYAKVPQPIHYCADDTVIGAPFYIMERLKGVILRTPLSPDVSISPDQFNRLSHALVENLASLHSIDIFSTGLIELGKPE